MFDSLGTNKYRATIILAIIIAVQVAVLVYWSSVKTNYHVDELYSIGYASAFTDQTYNSKYITTSKDFWFNKWINNSDLKEYLIMTDNESVFSAPFSDVVKRFITGRNYMGFLNIAESLFGNGTISHLPGFLLNVFFYILTDIALYLLFKRLNVKEHIRYLAVLMIGLTGYMISAAEFIRFYMLVILLTVIMLILTYKLWNTNEWKEIIISGVFLVITGYFSLMDSELTLPFFGAFWGCLFIAFIFRHKKKQLLAASVVLAGGTAFLALGTNFLDILFDPDSAMATQSSWYGASARMRFTSINTFKYYLDWLVQLFNDYYFASFSIIIVLVGLVSICVVLTYASSEDEKGRFEPAKISPVTVTAFIVWIGIFGITTMIGQGRLICLAVLYILLVIGICEAIGYAPKPQKIRLSDDTVFIISLLFGTSIYAVFLAMCGLDTWRYFCYGFVSVAIAFWFFVDRLMNRSVFKLANRNIYIGLAVFVVINSLLLFKVRNVMYLFEDEKPFIECLSDYNDLDVIMFLPVDIYSIRVEETGYLPRHAAYDCVYLMPDETKIYVTEVEEYTFDRFEHPDDFIAWTTEDCDMTDALNELEQNGYDIQELGCDHNSKVYVARGKINR